MITTTVMCATYVWMIFCNLVIEINEPVHMQNKLWECEKMHFNVFGTGHCLFHDIDEDSFIMSEIVFR
jgi:hypothetical protein